MILKLAEYTRVKHGPREAAYFAALDAIGELGEGSPIEAYALPHLFDPSRESHGKGFDNVGTTGVVAAIAKEGKDSEKVSFVTKKVQYMDQECRETNKIDRIENTKVIYRIACHDTGLKWGNDGPLPVHAQTSYSDGVKVGRKVQFDDTMGSQAIPLLIYADGKGTRLVGVATFLLD